MLSRLNISTLHSRRKHLDSIFFINVFKNKISSSIFDTVSLRIPLGELETSVPWWLTISRSACQPDVFLLLMLYARKLKFLIRTKLRLLISFNFAYFYTC
jgi:hypothetical protein